MESEVKLPVLAVINCHIFLCFLIGFTCPKLKCILCKKKKYMHFETVVCAISFMVQLNITSLVYWNECKNSILCGRKTKWVMINAISKIREKSIFLF